MNDLVDKATAWDACDASFKKGLAKGRAESADHIEAQNKTIVEMRAALEMIAGVRPCVDNLLGNADIARMALSKSNPNTPERNDK